MKRLFALTFLIISIFSVSNARAGIPVIDGANLAQSIQQVIAWAQQAAQMAEQIGAMEQQVTQLDQQISQLEREYNSFTGSRGMGNLVNDFSQRAYLPVDYSDISSNGYGDYEQIRSDYQRLDLNNTYVAPDSVDGLDYSDDKKQASIQRALAEDTYTRSNNRFTDLQVLLNQVNNVSDPKDVADLQARIQAENAMLLNEQIRMSSVSELNTTRDRLIQQRDRDKCAAKYYDSSLPVW